MAAVIDITPTIDQVALLSPTRTTDKGGTEVGAFSSTTRPSDVQATGICDMAARDTWMALNLEDDDALPDELVADALRARNHPGGTAHRAVVLSRVRQHPEPAGTAHGDLLAGRRLAPGSFALDGSPASVNERRLAERAAQGDQAAFGILIERSRARIHGLVSNFTSDDFGGRPSATTCISSPSPKPGARSSVESCRRPASISSRSSPSRFGIA